MVTPLVTVILHYFLRIESKENVLQLSKHNIFMLYKISSHFSHLYTSAYGGTWTLTHIESTHKLHKIL